MSGIALQIQERGLDQAMHATEALAALDKWEMMDTVGRLIQLQTRRRIAAEKSAPDGTAWKPNRAGSSILYASQALHDSIDYRATPEQTMIGSPLVYAAIHHTGGVIKPKEAKALAFRVGNRSVFAQKVTLPARPYLGLSPDNVQEAETVVADFITEVLQ